MTRCFVVPYFLFTSVFYRSYVRKTIYPNVLKQSFPRKAKKQSVIFFFFFACSAFLKVCASTQSAGNQPLVMHAKPEDHRTAVLFLSPSKHAEGATKHHFEEDVKPQCFFWKAVNRGLCILAVWDSGELFWINNYARLLQCSTKRNFFSSRKWNQCGS